MTQTSSHGASWNLRSHLRFLSLIVCWCRSLLCWDRESGKPQWPLVHDLKFSHQCAAVSVVIHVYQVSDKQREGCSGVAFHCSPEIYPALKRSIPICPVRSGYSLVHNLMYLVFKDLLKMPLPISNLHMPKKSANNAKVVKWPLLFELCWFNA